MAHTPGKWEAFPSDAKDDERLGVQSKHGPIVADCGIASNPHSLANARLIAAAPDLLEALMTFEIHYPGGINPYLDSAYRMAIDAIRKATGK
jgi:hypothetical protein